MFTPVQKRLKDMCDHFEEMVTGNKGITQNEFDEWCKNQEWKSEYGDSMPSINFAEFFKKLRHEFKGILFTRHGDKEGRLFMQRGLRLSSSLYVMHVGIPTILQRAANKTVLKIAYHHVNDPLATVECLLQPEHFRNYNGKTYVFGRFADTKGKLWEDKHFHLDVNMIDSVSFSRRKPFAKSGIEWEAHFEHIIGIDNFEKREVEKVVLRVAENMINRFKQSELAKYIDPGHGESCCDGYVRVTLKIKRNKELEREILWYGSDLIVEAPNSLKTSIAKHVRQLSEFYR